VVIADSNFYFSKKEVKQSENIVYKEWLNINKFKQVKKECYKRENKLIKSVRSDLAVFCEAYQSYIPVLYSVQIIEDKVEENLFKKLLLKLSFKKTNELLSRLNTPLQDNFYKKEEYDLLHADNLASHVKEYEWIYSRYGELHPYTIIQAKKKLKTFDKEKYKKQKRIISRL